MPTCCNLWTTPSSNWILLLLYFLAKKTFQKKWRILSSDFVLKGIFKWIVICEKKTDQSDHALKAGWKKPKFLTRISFGNWNISGRFKPFSDFPVFSDEKQYSSDNNGPETLDTITLTSSFTSTSTRWNYTHITARDSGWSSLCIEIFRSQISKM